MNNIKSISYFERQTQVLKFIESVNQVTVSGISAHFNISEATVRRDLDNLAEQGKIQRIHGGAKAIRSAPPELPVYQRMQSQTEAKKNIGSAAARLVNEHETIFLGSGTSVYEVARNLTDFKDLTVITNSVLVINHLLEYPNISLIVLGGVVRRSELSLIGHTAEQALSELRADKVFLGIHGIDFEHGLTNHYLQETMTDRKILQIGREVILVADHTKFGQLSTAFVAPIKAVHTLVTDKGAPDETVESVRNLGIRVILA